MLTPGYIPPVIIAGTFAASASLNKDLARRAWLMSSQTSIYAVCAKRHKKQNIFIRN